MKIAVVDDESSVRRYVCAIVRSMGHQAIAFADARSALAAISDDIDLIISDVSLDDMDGFNLARAASEKIDAKLPMTLLMSGLPHTEQLDSTPPSIVLGLIRKPFRYLSIVQVLNVLEKTRSRCPGTLDKLRDRYKLLEPEEDCAGFRDSADYGLCPNYDDVCGGILRNWIGGI